MSGSNASGTRRHAGWATGLAAAAVLMGHGVTYALVHPDGHERAGVLATTGHAYLHLLEGPAVVLALGSLIAAAALGLRRLGEAPDRRALCLWLATVQVAAFGTMEVVERIGAGTPSLRASDAALLVVGVVVQLVLARLGAWTLDLARRGGRRIADALGTSTLNADRPASPLSVPLVAAPVVATLRGPRTLRGPPLRRR